MHEVYTAAETDVLIPFSSGEVFGRLNSPPASKLYMVLIPFSSGEVFGRHATVKPMENNGS